MSNLIAFCKYLSWQIVLCISFMLLSGPMWAQEKIGQRPGARAHFDCLADYARVAGNFDMTSSEFAEMIQQVCPEQRALDRAEAREAFKKSGVREGLLDFVAEADARFAEKYVAAR